MKTPSFFVVGAQKAGTTALHDWLWQQPDVCLPAIKETHFFSHEIRYSMGSDWYQRQFQPRSEEQILGEVDPEYLYHPVAARRMAEYVENPKLIFLFRHPFDRAYSHYLMTVRRGLESLPFLAGLEAEAGRLSVADPTFARIHHSYLGRSLYAEQIRRYLQAFPHAECLFIKFDDLVSKQSGEKTYADICSFIGVSTDPALAQRGKKSNQASEPRLRALRDLLYRPSRLKKLVGRLIPSQDAKLRLAMMLDKLNQTPLKNKESYLLEDISMPFRENVAQDIEQVVSLTGLPLGDWLERT